MKNGTPPPSVRVYACGVTGSGKTTLLRRVWLNRTRRALILDATGEWLGLERGARDVEDLEELRAELGRVAGRESWRIVAPIDAIDPADLAELLLQRGPSGLPYPRAVGGCALVIDELAEFAHTHCSLRITALWRRGRHAGLSIYGASQMPADVARAVTSQSGWLVLSAMHEPRHVNYLARIIPPAAIDALGALAPHHAILWDTSRRAGYLLDSDHKVQRELR